MKSNRRKVNVGIIGCGAIGSRIAHSVTTELKSECRLNGLYDINLQKSIDLATKLKHNGVAKSTLPELLKSCDFIIEAVNAQNTESIIRQALQAKKNVLAMSVGKLLKSKNLFNLARKNQCSLLLPSGALAGLDAVKAAALVNISSITLTTRKPIAGFIQSDYLTKKGIDLQKITSETVIFEGNVQTAVRLFPQNINVAATLALASRLLEKLKIRILTAPEFTMNSHEIEVQGDFGRIVTRTENVVCPDNPKTSYLAVLSGIQTLKQFFNPVKIGT